MPKKKQPPQKHWILANLPNDNNRCDCFKKKLPSEKWIIIDRFITEDICRQNATACSNFFMLQPIRKARMRKKMG